MNIVDKLVGLIAPNICFGCGAEGSVLCADCTELFYNPIVSRCASCRTLTDDFKVCKSCRSWMPIKSVYVALGYDGLAEKLIHAYKFDCQRQASTPMADIMTKNFSFKNTVICPVPTAPKRIRERGFDHALLLSKNIAKKLTLEHRQLLSRRDNIRQLGSGRAQRIRQMKDEFEINSDDISGKRVLLIDDVVTTGASLAAAARVLRDAGAKSVSALVFAQKNR